MIRATLRLLVLLCGLVYANASRATIGNVDPSFTGGLAATTMWQVDGMLEQPDGKIVIAGWRLEDRIVVARFLSDGSTDSSFGAGGVVSTLIGTDSRAYAVARQTDGKLVVAGWARFGSNINFALVRYDDTGALDPTFGTGGIVTTALANLDFGYAVAIRSDGKIVVAGQACTGITTCPLALAQYDTSGALDPGFGSSGKVFTAYGTGSDISGAPFVGMLLQPDGKILVNNGYGVVRLLDDGTLDTFFGTGGFGGGESGVVGASALALQPDGKILYAHGDRGVGRLTTSGQIDSTFGKKGFVLMGTQGIVLQPDGKIVTTEFQAPCPLANETADIPYYCGTEVYRATSSGKLDDTFGPGGIGRGALGAEDTGGRAVVLRPDGKILTVGYNGLSVELSRWLVDGCPQTIKPKLTITHQFSAVTKLGLTGTLNVPALAVINPAANGLSIDFLDGNEGYHGTVTVPGGMFWSANTKGTAWKYKNLAGGPGGIYDVKLSRSASAPTHVKFALHAKNSSYGYVQNDLPARINVTLDYTEPTPVLCSEANFFLGNCVLSPDGGKLTCK
jgi:uncharacterized delta-60 repeat protein